MAIGENRKAVNKHRHARASWSLGSRCRLWIHALMLTLPCLATPTLAEDIQALALDPVIVLGKSVRTSNSLSPEEIGDSAPGTSPLKLINLLPGASYTGSESFGAYEWGNDLSIRGFSGGQIGATLDHIPLGSNHFWYYSGIEAHRAIIAENLDRITVTPGSGALDVASYNALGAAMQLSSRMPEREFSARAGQMVGQRNAYRTYASLDSGEMDNGMSAYFSAATATSGKWKGMASPGQSPWDMFNRDDGNAVTGAGARWGNYHDQLNLKAFMPLAKHSLTLFYAYSDKRENDYADLTLPVYRQSGRNFDNYSDWRDAIRDVNEDAYFGSAMSYRNDHLLALTGSFQLGGNSQLEVTPYLHRDWGNGDWHIPYSENGAMTGMKFRRSKLYLDRSGINGQLTINQGKSRWSAGLWLEESRFKRQRYLYDLYDWQTSPAVNLDSTVATLLDRRYNMHTAQLFLRYDTPVVERIKLSLGAKTMRIKTDFTDLLGAYSNNTLVTDKPFLPQVGINWQINVGEEIFAYYAENASALPITAFTTRNFNPDIKPETSRTLETGWRSRSRRWEASASAYWISYRDRLLQIANCTLLGTCPSLLANVGSVRTSGAELSLTSRLTSEFSWHNALSYNDSRYLDNYVSAGSSVPTADKMVVNSPRRQFATALSYRWDAFFARLSGKYTSERAASYTNDLKVPGFALWSLAAGYERNHFLGLREFRAQFNVENLSNRDYLATLGAAGYYASDPTGTSTYAQVGAPRLAYVSMTGKF